MNRASVAVSALRAGCLFLTVGLVVVASGCREEPAIVIKFEPHDMSGLAAKTADLSARAIVAPGVAPGDLAVTAAVKPAPGAAKRAAECKVAADCVVEATTCCDCANGGKQQAVTKKQALADKAARGDKCKTAVCTMMMSTDPSCGQRADCVAGVCQLVKK